MNGKQRVKAALSGLVPDRVPYGEFAVDFDTAEKVLGRKTFYRAKARTQEAIWQGRRDEIAETLKTDIVELYEKLDCLDIVNLSCYAGGQLPPKDAEVKAPEKIGEGAWRDEKGRIYKYSDITSDITVVEDPTVWDADYTPEYFQDLEYAPPDESEFEVVDYVIEKLGGSRFIISPSGADIGLILLGGYERGLTEYLTNPEGVKAAHEYYLDCENKNDRVRIRKGADAVFYQNDYAHNQGLMLSPQMLRDFGGGVMKSRVANSKKHVDYVIKHSCGNNSELLGDFAEWGIDCYQSLQKAAGMGVTELYGRVSYALWGGVSVETLVSGTAEETAAETRKTAEFMKGKTGLILGSSHSVAVGTKYDNFMAMLDALEKYR